MPLPQVLVTGGTGFVGSRLTQELVRRGRRVKVLARPGSSRRALADVDPSRLEVVEGDVTIGHTVYRALSGCDRLFHVAAEFKIWDRRPSKILDAAIVGTRETLLAAQRRGIQRIVVTSSTAAVGATRDPTEMDETFAFNRENSAPYIAAKRKAEELALEMADRGLPLVVVNPATILGPGDYKPTPSADLLLTFLRWRMPFGFPYTPGGFSVVDVDDVVVGHILAMERGRVGQRYLLGGTNVTVKELFVTLAEITGLRAPGFETPPGLVVLGGALSEIYARFSGTAPQLTYKFARDYIGSYVWVTSRKAETELGYEHRPLRATLGRAIRFFLENRMVPDERAAKLRFDFEGLRLMGGFRVRTAREEDVEQLVEMGLCAYPASGGFDERKRNLTRNSFGSLRDVRVIEKDGRIAGQAALYPLEMWLGGRRVPCAAIASVSVTPGERREGVSHALFEQLHAEVSARKAALTLLYPFREGFYARLGYATTVPLVTLRVAAEAIAHAECLADAGTGFTFRTLEGSLVTEARALYEEVAAGEAGRIVRSEERWLKLFSREARHWIGAVSGEGRLEGYLSFSYDVPMIHGRQTLVIHELTARGQRSRRALLFAIGKQRDQIDDVEITVPLGDSLPFAFHDAPGSRRGTAAVEHPLGVIGAGPMVRLTDAARALTLRGYAEDGELAMVVSEPPPSSAPKTLRLVVRNGTGEVVGDGAPTPTAEKEEAALTVHLALSTLGSIVAAGLRPSDAAQLGLLRADDAALAAADSLFAGPRFQCLDPF